MKRAIALFLALVFVFGLIPVSALAAAAPSIEIKFKDPGTTPITVTGTVTTDPALADVTGTNPLVAADSVATVTAKNETVGGKPFLYWKVGNSGRTTAGSYEVGFTATSEINVVPVYGYKLDLTVDDGSGDGTYYHEDSITVTAEDKTAEGKTFDHWTVVSGDANALDVIVERSATFDAKALCESADKTLTLKAEYTRQLFNVGFVTSGIAVAKSNLANDSFIYEAPLSASADDVVYVRVAETSDPSDPDAPKDRKVTGISFYNADGTPYTGTIDYSEVAGQEEDKFATYQFTMPAANIKIGASYQYKITLNGTTGSLNSGTDGDWWWGTPGTEYTLTVAEDTKFSRRITDWVFAPDLEAKNKATTSKVNADDIEERKAVFTMPSEPLAITVKYDRELVKNYITVVNGVASSATKVFTSVNLIEEGTEVTITATDPADLIAAGTIPEGYEFQKWIVSGDEKFVAAITPGMREADTFKFNMPQGGGTLTAQYVGTYELATNNVASVASTKPVTAAGKYEYDTVITITANAPEAGIKKFDHWTYTREGISEPSDVEETPETGVTSPATTKFTMMPNSGQQYFGKLTVTAHYRYKLTIEKGYIAGSGAKSAWLLPGEAVRISASSPASGELFKSWEQAGTKGTFQNVNANTTVFTMGAEAETVTATYGLSHKAEIGNAYGYIGVTGEVLTQTAVVAAEGTSITAKPKDYYTYGGKYYAFKEWICTSTTLTDKNGDLVNGSPTAAITFAMPKYNVKLTPKFEVGYSVTVTNGNGTGYYPVGRSVTITAQTLAGKEFDHWDLTYYPPDSNTATTIQVAGNPYTFEMGGSEIGKGTVKATAVYTSLFNLKLQSKHAKAGELQMWTTAENKLTGGASVSGYWKKGTAVKIATPEKVTVDSTEYKFTKWVLVSGSGTIGKDSSASTTFTMSDSGAVLMAQYGSSMLIYKTSERDGSDYNNWEYANYNAGDLVQLVAQDPDNTFVRWASEPMDMISDRTNPSISFKMPAGTVKVWPEYGHKLTLTDGQYSLDGGSTWNAGGGKSVAITAGDTVIIRPIEDLVGTETTGQLLFSSWKSNSTRISYHSTTKQVTFTMPPEDVTASVNYKTYTLTVYKSVDSTVVEKHALHPGEYFTITSEEASGGRTFKKWEHTDGLLYTVNTTKYAQDDARRVVAQRITVQMPDGDAYIQALYDLYPRYDYWNTDAFIRVEGEPKRYYALLEYFQLWDMKVIYYPGLTGSGVEVDPSDYVLKIVKAGTNEVATTSDFCFTQEGAFDIIVTMIVDGRQMAPEIRVMDQPSTHLFCTATRAEFVQSFTMPSRTEYYEGEEVIKDGLDVLLRSADHTGGAVRYSTVRELDESEYKLKPWGTGWDEDGNTNTKLPTITEIQSKINNGKFGYKLENGRYYVCMEVTDCFDYTQLNSDGSYMRMEYIVNDAKDYIWVEVRKPVTNISLEAIRGDNTADVINNVPSTTYPFVSWEITEDLATAQSGIRKLKVNADGYTDAIDLAGAMEYVISDPNVAYLEPTNDPLVWNVKIKSAGVTTITFRALGDNTVSASCEITVKTDAAVKPMQTLKPDGLNQSSVNLYVGSEMTLYPVTFTPSDANTACNWVVRFSDGLQPQNAEYYVKVNAAGVVEVLKYTDRPVRIYALPTLPAGQNTIDKAEAAYPNEDTGTPQSLYAYCNIRVLQIPVDNMTLYPTAMTMYRLATRSLKVTLYPEAASDKTIRWTSTDSSVASVDNNGNVTANKLGTAKITATSESNPKVFQTCTITVKQSVLLTGLTLNRTSATLGIEDTLVLTPYFTPATATTKSVTWSSNATTVATVDSNGKVRGLSEGVAVITATANDGTGKQVSCVVSVSTIVTSAVVLNKQTLALIEDDSETLVATVYPTNVSNSKVHWTSSNENVATVDPDGVVTAMGGGSAVITATARDASTKYADCVVAVTAKIPVTSLTLNLGNFDILLNDTTLLKATVAPANATHKLVWSSNNTAVATVDENGKISALATGDAVITCKAGDITKAITVSVVTKTFSTGKVVNCTRRVNVRAKASGTSTVLGYAYLGDVYKVLDKSTNWYKIQYNAGTVAYIWSRYLSATETGAGYVSAGRVGAATTDATTGTTTSAPVVTAKTLTITNCTYCVNVRSGAGTTFSRLGYAYLDEAFTYTGTQGDWYIITYNGATAYVSSQFVKVN